jgi:hypothetical protein
VIPMFRVMYINPFNGHVLRITLFSQTTPL